MVEICQDEFGATAAAESLGRHGFGGWLVAGGDWNPVGKG